MLLVGVRLRAIRQAGHRLLLKAEVKRAPRALPTPAAADAAQPPTFVDAVRSTKTPTPMRWTPADIAAVNAMRAALSAPATAVDATTEPAEPRSAGKKSEWLPAPGRRRSTRRSGGAPHAR